MKTYVYPKLPAIRTFSFFRIGGSGLANCMFVAARAKVLAEKYNLEYINPTWLNISIGTYFRGEKDKRHYNNIFRNEGVSGLKKVTLLITHRKTRSISNLSSSSIFIEEGLKDYFLPLIPYQKMLKDWFFQLSKIQLVDEEFTHSIGIHIRLSDFISEYRTPIEWYITKINQIRFLFPSRFKFLLFSDGSDEELRDILALDEVQRCFLGNAFGDIMGMSKCLLLLGSDSTFSGWGAFFGQKPSLFNNKHYGRIMIDEKNEIILKINEELPEFLIDYLRKTVHCCDL